MIEQKMYECPACSSKIILYGGKTSNTAVVCNCGKWMRIYDDADQTKLLNKGMERLAGEVAVSQPLNVPEEITKEKE